MGHYLWLGNGGCVVGATELKARTGRDWRLSPARSITWVRAQPNSTPSRCYWLSGRFGV